MRARFLISALVALLAMAVASAAPALAKVPASYLQEDKTIAYEYAGIEGEELGVTLPGGPEVFLKLQQSSRNTLPSAAARTSMLPSPTRPAALSSAARPPPASSTSPSNRVAQPVSCARCSRTRSFMHTRPTCRSPRPTGHADRNPNG